MRNIRLGEREIIEFYAFKNWSSFLINLFEKKRDTIVENRLCRMHIVKAWCQHLLYFLNILLQLQLLVLF